MPEVGSKLLTLPPVAVAAPGTAVAVPTAGANGAAKTVIVQGLSTNEEPVVVGDSAVVAATGTHAAPTQRGVELVNKATLSIDVNDSTEIWVDARKAKDGVSVTLLLA